MVVDRSARGREREDRFIGALLGTAYGDVLGAGVEGMDRETIKERFGEIRDFLSERGRGRYTENGPLGRDEIIRISRLLAHVTEGHATG